MSKKTAKEILRNLKKASNYGDYPLLPATASNPGQAGYGVIDDAYNALKGVGPATAADPGKLTKAQQAMGWMRANPGKAVAGGLGAAGALGLGAYGLSNLFGGDEKAAFDQGFVDACTKIAQEYDVPVNALVVSLASKIQR